MIIKIDGFDNFDQVIDKIIDPKRIERSVGKACALVERTAKENAPKDTGALRRSITSEVEINGSDIVGSVFTPLEYAPYVEYGTGIFAEESGRQDPWRYQDDEGNWHTTTGQKPQPYMRPALDENREQIKKIILRGIIND